MKSKNEHIMRGRYTVKRYGNEYKITYFEKGFNYTAFDVPSDTPTQIEKFVSDDDKERLSNNLSRAKARIFELASCNEWDYFVTLTLNPEYDRTDLSAWRKSFTQWVRDLRKKGQDIRYLLVPEQHKSGEWHMHGFFSGLSGVSDFAESDIGNAETPQKSKELKAADLNAKGYKNWHAYSEKYGYCSLAPLRDHQAAARYITKYITKSAADVALGGGAHLFYASKGLNGARLVSYGATDDDIIPRTLEEKAFTHYYCNEYVQVWWLDSADKLPILDGKFAD